MISSPKPFMPAILPLLASALFLCSCAQLEITGPSALDTTASAPGMSETSDPSCSYFYFLWASHAEYNQSFIEALEAYEKALICDPEAEYIAEKIPVLLIQLGRLEEASQWLEKYIAAHPEKTVQRFMLARLKIEEKKEDEAIRLYQEALNLEPDNENIRLRLGLLYSNRKQFKDAEATFLTILKNNNESYFATLYLARLYTKTGDLEQAEKYFLQALKLNWSKDLSFEIADFYNLQKRFNDALALYRDVLSKDDKDESAALGLIQVLLFLEKGEEALQELDRLRGITNNPERIDLVRSQILINMGQREKAKDILLSILKSGTLYQANYLLAVIYYEEKNPQEALSLLQLIPESVEEFRDSILLQVRILEEENKSDQSIATLNKVLANDELRQPFFFSLLSSIYQREEKNEEAIKTLSQGISHFPEDETLLYDYAILLEKSNRHDEAFASMDKLLSLNPGHADALNFIGYTWADRNIHLEKAYEYIQKAVELKPQSGYIQDSLGWVLYRLGKLNSAKFALEKAILLEPNDPFIHDHLGDIYRAMKNPDKARTFYRKAIELLSDTTKKEQIREKLNDLDNK